jgi:hypothetical protein
MKYYILHNPKFQKSNCYAAYILQSGFLLVLFLHHEDGGDMFIRNDGSPLTG